MDTFSITKMVNDAVQRAFNVSRFTLTTTSNHTHNGIDSKVTYQPTLSYAGLIPSDAGADPLLGFILPQGWTMSNPSTGSYLITHNLDTTLYSIVACAIQSTNEKVACVINPLANSFEVNWFKLSDNTAAQTSFCFTLTQINNGLSSNPVYTTLNRT